MQNFALHANVKKPRKKNYYYLMLVIIFVFCQTASYYTYGRFGAEVNHNLFFGLFGNNYSAILINCLVVLVLFYFIHLKTNRYPALLLMVTGICSNTIDRILKGGVIDYITIWQIPSFNIADVVITISVIWMSLTLIKQKNT